MTSTPQSIGQYCCRGQGSYIQATRPTPNLWLKLVYITVRAFGPPSSQDPAILHKLEFYYRPHSQEQGGFSPCRQLPGGRTWNMDLHTIVISSPSADRLKIVQTQGVQCYFCGHFLASCEPRGLKGTKENKVSGSLGSRFSLRTRNPISTP